MAEPYLAAPESALQTSATGAVPVDPGCLLSALSLPGVLSSTSLLPLAFPHEEPSPAYLRLCPLLKKPSRWPGVAAPKRVGLCRSVTRSSVHLRELFPLLPGKWVDGALALLEMAQPAACSGMKGRGPGTREALLLLLPEPRQPWIRRHLTSFQGWPVLQERDQLKSS